MVADASPAPPENKAPATSAQPPGGPENLVQHLKQHYPDRGFFIHNDYDRSLVQSLRAAGMSAWTLEEAKEEAKNEAAAAVTQDTVLVCLNPQAEPPESLAGIIQTCQALLLVWETPHLLIENASPERQVVWLNWLAEQGFFHNPAQRPQFGGYQAIVLTKSSSQSPASLAAGYEKILWQLGAENNARRALLNEMRDELSVNGFDTAEIQVRLN